MLRVSGREPEERHSSRSKPPSQLLFASAGFDITRRVTAPDRRRTSRTVATSRGDSRERDTWLGRAETPSSSTLRRRRTLRLGEPTTKSAASRPVHPAGFVTPQLRSGRCLRCASPSGRPRPRSSTEPKPPEARWCDASWRRRDARNSEREHTDERLRVERRKGASPGPPSGVQRSVRGLSSCMSCAGRSLFSCRSPSHAGEPRSSSRHTSGRCS